MFILILTFLALFIEGIGIINGRPIALILVLLTPLAFLYSANAYFPLSLRERAGVRVKSASVKIPLRLKTLFILLLAFTLVSTLFSQDVINSLKFTLLYIAAFSAFICSLNQKEFIKKWIVKLMFGFSFFFCIYSIYLSTLNSQLSTLFIPTSGYQLVFSRFGSHNHLGDFLLLPLIALFYDLFTSRAKSHISTLISQLSTLFFLPYFLFSYSRSSYLSLIITLCIMVIILIRKKLFRFSLASVLLLIFVLSSSVIFMFSTATTTNNSPMLSKVNYVLASDNGLRYKTPYGGRGEYIRESVLSIIEKPIFGVGPGNFIFASKKYESVRTIWTETAHNIFFDIAAENGIPAGIIFTLIIFEIFRKSRKNLYLFFTLAMILNFQTDYTYRIYSLLILFFILLGIMYAENQKAH